MMDAGGRVDVWSQKWATGKARWHLDDLHYALVRHGTVLLPSPDRRVFVPLCGKSVDLKWFYDQGHTVVGVEGVKQPILEFFTEHNLTYTLEELTWGKLYKTKDGRLSIYHCDLLKVDTAALGKFNSVWDRGSLVAINEEDLESYVQILKSLLAPDFCYMLSITQYTPNEIFSGPPRNIPTELMEEFFGDTCKLKILETNSWPMDEERHVNGALDTMTELVINLTPKN